MPPTITAFKRSSDGGKGLARDMGVRWALDRVADALVDDVLRMAAMSDAIRSAREAAWASGLADYGEYLRSSRWLELRSSAIARDGCRGCGTAEYLQVHHRRYPRSSGARRSRI